MKATLAKLFTRRITLVIASYALLVKLLFMHDGSTATLAALFLSLVAQLGHKALDYYGSVKDAVQGVVGVHADRLNASDRVLSEHATKLENIQKTVEIVAKAADRKPLF